MARRKSFIYKASFEYSVLSIVSVLWLIAVATTWSCQSTFKQMLAREKVKFAIPESPLNVHHAKASQQIQPLENLNELLDENNSFVCDTALHGAKRHQPILMIANSRTGSNLLFSFIGRLAAVHKPEVDVLLLYELFAVEKELQVEQLSTVIDQIRRGCGWDSKELYSERKFASPGELFATALAEFNSTSSQQQVLWKLQQVFDQRYKDPASFISFIHRVPSQSSRPYFALKVFPYHIFEQMNSTVANFASIFAEMDAKYIVLWRRSILEVFVSMKIAAQRNAWTLRGTTKDDAIEVGRDALEWYIQEVGQFYLQARDYFELRSIPFEEFEYGRDLIDASNHAGVLQRIQTKVMHQSLDEGLVQEALGPPGLAKQALVPLSQQIVNWNEVASWGYSESLTDWPDLFASSASREPVEEKQNTTTKTHEQSHPEIENFSQHIQPVEKLNVLESGRNNFVCDTALDEAKPHQPILMIANSRTGSNLLFSFIGRLAALQKPGVDVLLLYELFARENDLQVEQLSTVIDQIRRGCGWDTKELYFERKFASPEELFETALVEFNSTPAQQQVFRELQQVFNRRYEDPAGYIKFIHRVPSQSTRPYFALKVFPYHVFELLNTTVADFASIFSGMDPEHVVLWRRNVLEIFVSMKIADQRNAWTLRGTTKDDAIEVNRDDLEWYIQNVGEFYSQARDYFASKSIPFEEFEYGRDLIDASNHAGVLQRIQTKVLHQAADEGLVREALGPPGLAKQALVPLSQQIVNWNDVVSWGYSESPADWPDLFSQKMPN